MRVQIRQICTPGVGDRTEAVGHQNGGYARACAAALTTEGKLRLPGSSSLLVSRCNR
jgi:hypothetical protein